MYRKRTRTTQENTGNSKKRRLKYELYDSRFHKSYNNIKTGNYDDNNMLMDGGSSAPASEKKEIFYDDKNEVHNFLEKWFKDTENKYKTDGINNDKLNIGELIKNFKETFSDTDTDNLLLTLFKKFLNNNEEQLSSVSNENSFNTTDYINTIIKQINKEEKNTVAVFKYDLYLYNLDSILKKYKTAKNTNVFTNFLKTLNIEKNIENTKKIFQFDANSFSNADATNDSKKIIMYIPKFLKKIKSDIEKLKGGAKTEPYEISKLKELENSNKTTENKLIRTDFNKSDLWNTVLNTDKPKHYGFVDAIPKNLLSQEFTLSVENEKKQIQKYLDKCNDLQYLYINKHIELLEIFKLINIYTKHNDDINKIIKKLVDPKYYNIKGKNDDIDGVVKLVKPLLEEMGDLSKTPSITGLEKKLSGTQSGGAEETKEVLINTLIALTKKKGDFFKNNKTYEFIRKNEENETETEKVIMTVSNITDDNITFKNIKTQNNTDLDTFFTQDTGYLDTTDEEEPENDVKPKPKPKPIIDVKEVNHIVSIDDYEFLQLIKQIQLSNEKSIKQILGETPDVKKDKIDKLIQNFKQGSKPYTNQNGNNNKWKSFNIDNNNNFYFNNSNSQKKKNDRKSSKDTDVIQKVIYKCYDLQILYLVKHIEVVEMFKLLYYYYDMMIKKIGILFFILSLYSKSNINITDIILDNSIFLPVGKNIKTAVNPNISGGSIGGGGNDDIKDILTKLNAVDENKYNTTKTDHKSKVLTEIKTFNSKTVNDEKQLTLLFNNLLTYFQKFSKDEESIKNYNYIDKLLIKLLKKIIPDIIDKNEKISNEKQKEEIFNVMEQIVYDIKNKEIQIQQEQDRVKKNKSLTSTSSYGVKAGQSSKMDFEISKTITTHFSKIFDYGIKKVIGDGKESITNLDKITSLMLYARKLIGELSDKSNTNELKTKITEIEDEMIKLFEQTYKFAYIFDTINNNRSFDENDIPTSEEDPLHIKTSLFEEYRLNFLELLKNVYFPKDKSINIEKITVEEAKELLNNVLNRVKYKGQNREGKSNVIYIKEDAYNKLNDYILGFDKNEVLTYNISIIPSSTKSTKTIDLHLFANLTQELKKGGGNDMFTENSGELFFTDKCNILSGFNEYKFNKIFTPPIDIYESLFNDNNDKNSINLELNKSLQVQTQTVVLFNFGSSTSKKTDTMIDMDNKSSILYTFIEKNNKNIQKIEFVGIYTDHVIPRFYVGIEKDKINLENITQIKNTEIEFINYGDTIKQNVLPESLNVDNPYKTIDANFLKIMSDQITKIKEHRKNDIRNKEDKKDNFKNYLQITITLNNNSKLVIFDTPDIETYDVEHKDRAIPLTHLEYFLKHHKNIEDDTSIENPNSFLKYGLLQILQNLVGYNLSETKTEKKLPVTELMKQFTNSETSQSPLKFIILANINNNNTENTNCNNALKTLQIIKNFKLNNTNTIYLNPDVNKSGGSNKKKYYKDIKSSLSTSIKKHRIKRFITLKKLKKNKKNLFTSKTKKLL